MRLYLVALNPLFLALTCTGSVMAGALPPEDPVLHKEDKKSAWLHEVYLQDASQYEFYLDATRRQKLELRHEPVMRWASESDYHGEVYAWTHQGRAVIIGCIYSGPRGDSGRAIAHEFHSLGTQPLAAGARGASGWLPEEAGITPKPIPNAPEPADSEARRLAQMRDLARRFNAQMMNRESKWELRLLPQPLYRYELVPGAKSDSPVVDGAVFAYVWTVGTDPEVLLVIEARRTERGMQWFYSPARFTNREAWVTFENREVWRVPAASAGIFDGITSKSYGAFSIRTVPNQGESP